MFCKMGMVIGAGTMGSGIAQVFAVNGCEVVLNDIKDELLTYLKPLIQGEVQIPYDNGIPKRFIL